METNEGITEFYHSMKCPREVRYYCKEMALLTQKLMLPLRCCTYLIYLGQADLYSNRLDDCRVKLNGIADILCFNRYNTEVSKDLDSKFDFELECIIKDMEGMQLEVKPSSSKNPLSSPVLDRETSNVPSFFHHDKSCNSCFACNCTEYQDLVLKKIHLEAMINVKQNDFNTAKKLFYGGLSLYQFYFEKRFAYDSNNGKCQDMVLRTETFAKSYGQLLLDFSKFLINVNKKSSAKIINEKLIKFLETFKYKCLNLYHQALLTKLALLADIPEIVIPITSPVENTEEIIKTPEHNQNKVAVTVQKISPCSPIVKIPLKKRLQFEASPEDNNRKNITNKKETRSSKKQASTSREAPSTSTKENVLTAKKERMKTAAPTIKIYTEDGGEGAVHKGRITRAKADIAKNSKTIKKTESKSHDLPQTTIAHKSVRRKLTSRKNLLGELNEK